MTENRQKIALVTGAAKRIGRHIALALAKNGWDVAVHYRHSENEARATVGDIEALGQRAIAVRCDLSDETAVKALLPSCVARLGAITCVVNNASIFEYDNVIDFSKSRLDTHMHTNLAAPILLAHALHATTAEGSQSVVINLLDQKLFNLNPDFLSYTLSKAALHSATIMLAQALAPKVRVVGLAPGITLPSGDQTLEQFEKAHAATPLNGSSSPDDIAAAVCFLAASRAITGTTLLVDGGQHLVSLQRDVMFVTK